MGQPQADSQQPPQQQQQQQLQQQNSPMGGNQGSMVQSRMLPAVFPQGQIPQGMVPVCFTQGQLPSGVIQYRQGTQDSLPDAFE